MQNKEKYEADTNARAYKSFDEEDIKFTVNKGTKRKFCWLKIFGDDLAVVVIVITLVIYGIQKSKNCKNDDFEPIHYNVNEKKQNVSKASEFDVPSRRCFYSYLITYILSYLEAYKKLTLKILAT